MTINKGVKGMKTITNKGKVYQIGGRYVDGEGNIGQLQSCDGRRKFKMISGSKGFWFCDELRTYEMGTIEDAPLELENGFWYMCEKVMQGQRCEVPYYYRNGFNTGSNSKLWSPASNYGKPLYKMTKSEP
tara:strand:- start:198 stop:587 length:390 start_codon:yes stop_codon:yes gene_type:complete